MKKNNQDISQDLDLLQANLIKLKNLFNLEKKKNSFHKNLTILFIKITLKNTLKFYSVLMYTLIFLKIKCINFLGKVLKKMTILPMLISIMKSLVCFTTILFYILIKEFNLCNLKNLNRLKMLYNSLELLCGDFKKLKKMSQVQHQQVYYSQNFNHNIWNVFIVFVKVQHMFVFINYGNRKFKIVNQKLKQLYILQ